MATDQPFRFLDLPKELRLMVYDCLSKMTTYHEVNTLDCVPVELDHDYEFIDYYIENSPRAQKYDRDWPVYSTKILCKTISGLAILATCQQIASEAGTILHPKLRAISEGPAQIITNSVALEISHLADIIARFQLASSGKDIQNILDVGEERLGDSGWRPAGTAFRPVHITHRNNFLEPYVYAAAVQREDDEDWRSYLMHAGWTHLFIDQNTFASDLAMELNINGHLHFRMACLTAEEEEEEWAEGIRY